MIISILGLERIVLVHTGTKERVIVEVTFIDPKARFVSILWPMSGTYDLFLETNQLRPHAPTKRRRKHQRGVLPWECADIIDLHKKLVSYLAAKEGRSEQAVRDEIARHAASMPRYM